MSAIALSPDQVRAVDAVCAALKARSVAPSVLVGPAGTGKTTLLGPIAERITADRRAIRFAAPTGRAAKVLSEKLAARGIPGVATTIHRALYGSAEDSDEGLKFGALKEPINAGGVLVIDEASMVNDSIHADIMSVMPPRSSLLYVGDREQLPPVVGTWGADFDSPTAALTEVHRQALESPIVRIATDVRMGGRMPMGSVGTGYARKQGSIVTSAAWLAEHCRAGADATLLCATNGSRHHANLAVRSMLGLSGGPAIVPGDRLVVLLNSYDTGLWNGETVDVASVSDSGPGLVLVNTTAGHSFDVPVDLMGPGCAAKFRERQRAVDPFIPWVHVDYGWCLTIHKSQGSEWRHVGLLLDQGFAAWCRRDRETGRRLAYTGITRARESLTAFDI